MEPSSRLLASRGAQRAAQGAATPDGDIERGFATSNPTQSPLASPRAQTFDMPHLVDDPIISGDLMNGLTLTTALAIVGWPLSLPLLLCALGPHATNVLLVNAGILRHNPADRVARRTVTKYRTSLFFFHHVPALLYASALVALGFALAGGSPTDASAGVTYHMSWLQAIVVLLVLLPPRIELVAGVGYSVRPMHEVFLPTAATHAFALTFVAFPGPSAGYTRGGFDLAGISRGEPAAIMTVDAYDGLRGALDAAGATVLPSVDAVLATSPDGVLRLPDGRVVLALQPGGGSVSLGFMAWSSVSFLVALTNLQGKFIPIVKTTVLVRAAAALLPFIVRGALGVNPLGSNAAEHAVFLLFLACEWSIVLSPAARSGSVMSYTLQALMTAGLEWEVDATRLPPPPAFKWRPERAIDAAPPQDVAAPLGRAAAAAATGDGLTFATARVTGGTQMPRHHAPVPPRATPTAVRIVPFDYAALPPTELIPARAVAALAREGGRFRSCMPLDSVDAVATLSRTLRARFATRETRSWIVSSSFLSGGVPLLGIAGTLALALTFTIDPNLIADTWPDPGPFARAAVAPTASMLASVLVSLTLSLLAFQRTDAAVAALVALQGNVLAWRGDATRRLWSAMRELDAVAREGATAADLDDDNYGRPLVVSLARATARHGELAALVDELTGLHATIAHAIAHSRATRFRGVVRPGAVGIGSILAALVTITVLALRLAAAAYSGG